MLPGPEIAFGQYIKKVRPILEKVRPMSFKHQLHQSAAFNPGVYKNKT
jgi:hypothetical protein